MLQQEDEPDPGPAASPSLFSLLTSPQRAGEPPLDVILHGVADGITVQDPSGRLLYANAAAARIIGYASPQALLAAPLGEALRRYELLDDAGLPFPVDQLPGQRALRGERDAAATVRFRSRAGGEEYWSVVKATPIRDSTGAVPLAISVFMDVTERKRAEEAQRFLAEAGRRLAASLDYATTLQVVADLAVPTLADWCAVDIVEERGAIRTLAVAHKDPARVALARELQRRYPAVPAEPGGVAEVLRTGKPALYPDIPDALLAASARDPEHLALLRSLTTTSAMLVPLNARGRTLGALTLAWAESGRRFGASELAVAEQLAGTAALAIDNARLYREAREQAATQAELNAALRDLADARDRARAEAEAERDRLRQVLDALPAGIAIADAAGRIVLSNAAAEAIWGQAAPDGDAYHQEAFGISHLDGSPMPSEQLPLSRSVLGGDLVRGEQLLIRHAASGADTPVLVNSAPLTDASGAIAGGVVVFQDISAIRELDRQKDEFLAAVSHDLKNPLMGIKGHAQLLRRRAGRAGRPEPAGLDEGLSRIEAATERITAMVDELLDATRLQMGRPLDLDRKPVDLVLLAREAVETCRRTSSAHRLRLEADLPRVVGEWDALRLGRVLDNLLGNAVKYSPDGGEIVVTIDRAAVDGRDWATLAVRDRGMGIPAEDLPRIFEHFHRGGNVRDRIAGTGLGLAGARQIVAQHGGTITVESSERAGSTFTLRLPLVVDEQTAGAKPTVA